MYDHCITRMTGCDHINISQLPLFHCAPSVRVSVLIVSTKNRDDVHFNNTTTSWLNQIMVVLDNESKACIEFHRITKLDKVVSFNV